VTTGTTPSPTFTLLYRYGTVRYGTVRYGTVRYGTVRYDTVRYGTVRYGTVMKIPVPVSVSGSAYRIKVMVTQKIVSKRS
jgi:hypothetical protein